MRALALACLASALCLQAQPRTQEWKLQNGLRVLLLEDHEHPLVRARLFLSLRPGDTPPGRPGLAPLFHRMVVHAETADLKPGDLDRLLEDSGIRLTQSLGTDGFSWQLAARSRDQDQAMGLLADRLLRSLLDPALLELQRLAYLQRLEHPEGSPRERLRQALEPGARATRSSLGAITLQDLRAFRARVFRPDRAVLVLHGDLGLEQAKRLVLLSLGTWMAQEPGPQEAPPPSAAAAVPAVPDEVPRIPDPGAGLRVQALAPQPGDLAPEVGALLSLLVPGEASLDPVRVTLGEGGLVATLDSLEGSTGAATWSQLVERLEGLRRRGFNRRDLDQARLAWFGRRSLESLQPEAQMDRALAESQGRGVREDRLGALSLDGLNSGLRDWLDPAKLRLGAAGDPGDLDRLPRPDERRVGKQAPGDPGG